MLAIVADDLTGALDAQRRSPAGDCIRSGADCRSDPEALSQNPR